MKENIGIILLLIGITSGDSSCLLIPIALIAAGAYLLRDELK